MRPAGNERGPLYVDQAFAVVHQANLHRLPLSLELARERETLSLALSFPPEALGSGRARTLGELRLRDGLGG